jgi:NADH:ubiquinone oxidoreductase subunit 5 (subunit L)/multisubunit Na+/H+ antiporter MnhA subunit
VRLTGIVLLGAPRSKAAEHAHESSPWMIGPICVLVLLCLTAALLPHSVINLTSATLNQMLGPDASQAWRDLQATDVPVVMVGKINAWVLVGTSAIGGLLLALTRKVLPSHAPTWGCGFVKPTQRMQYTGKSFAELGAEHLLPRLLRPHTKQTLPRGLFPSEEEFTSECPDPITQRVYLPLFDRWADRFARLRILQQGKMHIYLVYIMLTVVLALAWASLHSG